MLVRDGSVDRTRVGSRAGATAMRQQAELALADLPVAPAPLGVAVPAQLHVPGIRTLFPAPDHVQADRSAIGRAVALWAATKRAVDLTRRHTASGLWARRWSRSTALTGPAAIIPVD